MRKDKKTLEAYENLADLIAGINKEIGRFRSDEVIPVEDCYSIYSSIFFAKGIALECLLMDPASTIPINTLNVLKRYRQTIEKYSLKMGYGVEKMPEFNSGLVQESLTESLPS